MIKEGNNSKGTALSVIALLFILLFPAAASAAQIVGDWRYQEMRLDGKAAQDIRLKDFEDGVWQKFSYPRHPTLTKGVNTVFFQVQVTPDHAEKSIMMFMTTNQAVKVWLGRRLIYERGDFLEKKWDGGMVMHNIELPKVKKDTVLTIELYADYSRHLGIIDKLAIDTELNQIKRMFYSDITFVLAMPVAMLIIIIMCVQFHFRYSLWKRFHGYILAFMLTFLFWSMCMMMTKALFLAKPVFWWYLLSTAAYVLPLTANLILYEILRHKPYAHMKWVIISNAGLMIIAIVGELLGYHTLNGMMDYYYPLMAVNESAAFYWCLRAARKGDVISRAIMVPTVAFTLCGLFDGMTSHYNLTPWRIYVTPLAIYSMIYFIMMILREQLLNERRIKLETINLADEAKKARRRSETDTLTGCYNRARLDTLLARAIADNCRGKPGFSVLLLDIDHFKNVNDVYGHEMGDRVLKNFAAVLLQELKSDQPCIRWGGEEFMVLLNTEKLSAAKMIAEKFRRKVELNNIAGLNITCSIGVASWLGPTDKLAALFKRVDTALYAAKAAGRNCVKS